MVEGALATFFELAQSASIPRVVRKEQLPTAIAQQEVSGGVVTLLGHHWAESCTALPCRCFS